MSFLLVRVVDIYAGTDLKVLAGFPHSPVQYLKKKKKCYDFLIGL